MSTHPSRRSGGVTNSGTVNTGGGAIVGGDMTVNTTTTTNSRVLNAFQPITDAVQTAAPAIRPAADATLTGLKTELEKADIGGKPNDDAMAGLLKGLVGLIPTAISAVVTAFANPILGAIAGPTTKALLNDLGATKQ